MLSISIFMLVKGHLIKSNNTQLIVIKYLQGYILYARKSIKDLRTIREEWIDTISGRSSTVPTNNHPYITGPVRSGDQARNMEIWGRHGSQEPLYFAVYRDQRKDKLNKLQSSVVDLDSTGSLDPNPDPDPGGQK